MKMTVEKVREVLDDVYKDTDLDIQAELSDEDIQEIIDNSKDYTDLGEMLKEELEESDELFNIEIIYYATAMEYLMENDCSLQESMGLAHDMGYTADNINSELLASILASQNAREEFDDLWCKVENHFEEIAFEEARK